MSIEEIGQRKDQSYWFIKTGMIFQCPEFKDIGKQHLKRFVMEKVIKEGHHIDISEYNEIFQLWKKIPQHCRISDTWHGTGQCPSQSPGHSDAIPTHVNSWLYDSPPRDGWISIAPPGFPVPSHFPRDGHRQGSMFG